MHWKVGEVPEVRETMEVGVAPESARVLTSAVLSTASEGAESFLIFFFFCFIAMTLYGAVTFFF